MRSRVARTIALVAVAAAAALALAAATLTATPLTVAAPPTFHASITRLSAAQRAAMTPAAWRPGCPVSLSDLRLLRLSHWGFDGHVHVGRLVVNRDVATRVVAAMRRLFALRYPIRRMEPIERFGGSDFRSIEADNTSAFNCRAVEGTQRWSVHASGRAIDINPIENPYVAADGTTSHLASRAYLDRSRPRRGVVRAGDAVVRAFTAEGFGWGGAWIGGKDYQHFSTTGH